MSLLLDVRGTKCCDTVPDKKQPNGDTVPRDTKGMLSGAFVAAGHMQVLSESKQAGTQLTFSLLFNPGLWPVERHLLQLRWCFPPLLP